MNDSVRVGTPSKCMSIITIQWCHLKTNLWTSSDLVTSITVLRSTLFHNMLHDCIFTVGEVDGRFGRHVPWSSVYKGELASVIYYIKLQCPFVCLSVCLYPLFFRHDRRTATKFGTHIRIDTLT